MQSQPCKSNSIKLYPNNQHKKISLVISHNTSRKYQRATIWLSSHTVKPAQEKHTPCLEVTGNTQYLKILKCNTRILFLKIFNQIKIMPDLYPELFFHYFRKLKKWIMVNHRYLISIVPFCKFTTKKFMISYK
jgi:hypothetical protein